VIIMAWSSWTTNKLIAGPGGVPTEEAGVLKGEINVHTTWVDGEAVVSVQYFGDTDWYTLAGSPVPCVSEQDSRELHQRVVRAVRAGTASTVLRGASHAT
jgi:hypothetical protein